jgi:adenylate cyclase
MGIHTGPIVAGVVGIKKFSYDIWGDAVNLAARMEQCSEPGKVNISASTYLLVKDHFQFQHRGKTEIKNKPEMDTYFVQHKM